VAADPGGRVAGSALRSLVMRQATSTVFWPFLVTVRPSCATWAAASDSVQAGASTVLMVRRARRPWSALPAEWRGWRPRAAFSAAGTASACWPGRSSRSRRLADDELRRVVLRVPCADRDNRGGAAGERFQQVPHRGSFVRFSRPRQPARGLRRCRGPVPQPGAGPPPVLPSRRGPSLPPIAITSRSVHAVRGTPDNPNPRDV
jgi:hypothetical protein